jgi:hypothetical protein
MNPRALCNISMWSAFMTSPGQNLDESRQTDDVPSMKTLTLLVLCAVSLTSLFCVEPTDAATKKTPLVEQVSPDYVRIRYIGVVLGENGGRSEGVTESLVNKQNIVSVRRSETLSRTGYDNIWVIRTTATEVWCGYGIVPKLVSDPEKSALADKYDMPSEEALVKILSR